MDLKYFLKFSFKVKMIFRCSGIPVFRHSGVPAFRCSGIQVFRHSGVPAFRCSGIPVFRHSGVPAFRCSGIPVFRHSFFYYMPIFSSLYHLIGRKLFPRVRKFFPLPHWLCEARFLVISLLEK